MMNNLSQLRKKAEKIKIIFFDIDDTLRVKTTGYMPESTAKVIEKLRAKGIKIGIATGRNLLGVVPEIRELNPDFYVTINGSYVENGVTKEVIYKNNFSESLIEQIIKWLESEKSEYAFVSKDNLRVSKWTEVAKEAITPVYQQLDEDKNYYQETDIFQMLTLSDHDDKLVVPDDLADHIRLVSWHPNSSDIVPREGSKAIGCQAVLDQLGLQAENMMNFGDGLNDRELFDMAELSVAMKKSHPEILEKADYITDTVENDGIEKALIALGLID